MSGFKIKTFNRDIPKDFSEDTIKTIERIDQSHNVMGVVFLRGGCLEMYTVPEITAQGLYSKLPSMNEAMHRAITEIDILNELVAYRIVTNSSEITVACQKDFCACVVQKTSDKRKKKQRAKKTNKA